LPQVVAGIWQKFGKGADRFSVSMEAFDSPGSNHIIWRELTMGRPNQQQPDQLSKALFEIEQQLNELGLGIEAWSTTPFHNSLASGTSGSLIHFGYAELDGRWQLVAKLPVKLLEELGFSSARQVGEARGENWRVLPLTEAPRRIQNVALERIPSLVGQIEEILEGLNEAVEAARDLAGSSRKR
jgi:hypothetical protein